MKWEYKTSIAPFHISKCAQENLESELNKYGEAGWELVSIAKSSNGDYNYLFFKRAVA